MTYHYDGEYRQAQEPPTIERFKIKDDNIFPTLTITMDGKEITVEQLVSISNQLASALNDRGCHFEVKK